MEEGEEERKGVRKEEEVEVSKKARKGILETPL